MRQRLAHSLWLTLVSQHHGLRVLAQQQALLLLLLRLHRRHQSLRAELPRSGWTEVGHQQHLPLLVDVLHVAPQ